MISLPILSVLALTACAASKSYATAAPATAAPATAADAAAPVIDLEAKLLHTFGLYESGRAALIERVAASGNFSREEWEGLLFATGKYEMGPTDWAALVAQHDADIAAALATARETSAVDLDAVRRDGRVAEFCAEMPRAAILHVHPSGTRNFTTIVEMLVELDPIVNGTELLAKANDGKLTTLYPSEIVALEALPVQRYSQFDAAGRYTIEQLLFLPAEPETHDFTRFEALFEIGDVLLEQDESKDVYLEEKTFVDFSRRASELGVSYVEFTKVEIPPTRAALDRFAELRDLILAKTGVIARFNFAFVRTIDPPTLNAGWVKDLLALVEEQPEAAMVGIDLLANEVNTTALATGSGIYAPVLAARQAGRIDFESTMHAGELGDVRNVRDAIIMGSTRIGHGVQLQEDVVSLEYARREKIGTVCSLKSNRLLQVWYDYGTHPFLKFLRLGMPVSLSTDDEGKIL